MPNRRRAVLGMVVEGKLPSREHPMLGIWAALGDDIQQPGNTIPLITPSTLERRESRRKTGGTIRVLLQACKSSPPTPQGGMEGRRHPRALRQRTRETNR